MTQASTEQQAGKALTLTEPWATLVMLGAKQYETRSWNTKHRGQLVIHAAKGFPASAKRLVNQEPFKSALDGYGTYKLFKLGHILGSVNLLDTLPTEDCEWDPESWEAQFGDYHPGRWAWKLSSPIWLPEPVPCKGALGLWKCTI